MSLSLQSLGAAVHGDTRWLHAATAPPQNHPSCILGLFLEGSCAGLVAICIANASVIISCTTSFEAISPNRKEIPVCGGGGRLDPPDTGSQPRVSHASLCFTMSKSNLHGQFSRLLDP